MVFQGLTRSQALTLWQPLLDEVDATPGLQTGFAPLAFVLTSAREFWSAPLLKRVLGFTAADDRPCAPAGNGFWLGDQGQAGQVLQGDASTWLGQGLLVPGRQAALTDALFATTRHWGVALHLNKGQAGATPAAHHGVGSQAWRADGFTPRAA